jgi:oxaloacetate decarboxylase beta subunit
MEGLFVGRQLLHGGNFMIAVGAILIYLAIAKEYEPTLLLPIGFGAILGTYHFQQQ